MPKLLQLIGKYVRSIRTAKKLTQQQLAEKAGISCKYLGEIERAQSNFSIDILSKIANVLEVDIAVL